MAHGLVFLKSKLTGTTQQNLIYSEYYLDIQLLKTFKKFKIGELIQQLYIKMRV